ncbi:hypothetical protein Scep_003479 [Stephania cephalantha]|uniref:Uncharacterized protein n=1 Tax=Stephania cephalantha TaxID=152367 RepID=A0AAP0KRI2_9MAGN
MAFQPHLNPSRRRTSSNRIPRRGSISPTTRHHAVHRAVAAVAPTLPASSDVVAVAHLRRSRCRSAAAAGVAGTADGRLRHRRSSRCCRHAAPSSVPASLEHRPQLHLNRATAGVFPTTAPPPGAGAAVRVAREQPSTAFESLARRHPRLELRPFREKRGDGQWMREEGSAAATGRRAASGGGGGRRSEEWR